MKVTDAQFNLAFAAYEKASPAACYATALLSAIESLPEPLPRLRPLSKMPTEVPEGALRLMGGTVDNYTAMTSIRCSLDTHFLDVLPPLPKSPKPSLQDELVTAVESYFEVWDNKDKKPGWCGRVEVAKNRVNELIAKAKGGQQ